SAPGAATYTVRLPSFSFTPNAILPLDGLITGCRCRSGELATIDSLPVARWLLQMLVWPDWLEKNATERPLFERDGNPRSAGPWVIRSGAPARVPRFKSKGKDQTLLLLSR